MKNITFMLVLLSHVASSQTTLKGIVLIQNSGKKPLPEVEIKSLGANPDVSNTEGVFALTFLNKTKGDYARLEAKRTGYDIVNAEEIKAVGINPDEQVLIFMCKEGEIDRRRVAYYNINEKVLTKAYNDKIAELKRTNKTTDAALSALAADYKTALKQLEEMTNLFAVMNVDFVSDLRKRAFEAFEKGQIDEAIAILKDETLAAELKKAKKEIAEGKYLDSLSKQKIKAGTEGVKQTALAYVDKAKYHILKLDFKAAEQAYDAAVAADSSNYDIVFAFTEFLYKQNQRSKAVLLGEKLWTLVEKDTNSEKRAIVLNNLGVFYRANQKMPQAEAAYNEALKIYRQLAEKNPDAFLPDVATTLNNLGVFYSANQKMPQAEAAYNEALKIYRQLAEKNPDAFLPDVAGTLNNLGVFYSDNQKMPQAEAAYNEALKIRRQLAEKNPDAFLPDVAGTLNNLGVFYSDNQKMPQAEAAYNEALKIRRQLAEKNPDAFLPDVATTLNNLGVFYSANQKMPQAEAAYNEALKIYRQLAEKNPDAFLPDVATILNNLGVFYRDNQKMQQAEAAYNEALKIRRQLAEKNPDAFLPDVAGTLNNLGVFYSDNQKMPQAEAAYNEALKIRRQLAEKNPDAFLPDVATTLNNLGVFYETLKNYKAALKYYGEAFKYREAAILRGGTHFFKDWVQVLRNISEVKDSAQAKKEYVNVAQAGQLLAEGCDKLKGINEKLLPIAVSEYGSLSWWALFAKDYALSEKAALRCLELDKTKEYVLTNLGHSQLLRGQYTNALATYAQLKDKKDTEGKDYKEVLLDDLKAIEAEGIIHKDMAKIKAEIEKWFKN